MFDRRLTLHPHPAETLSAVTASRPSTHVDMSTFPSPEQTVEPLSAMRKSTGRRTLCSSESMLATGRPVTMPNRFPARLQAVRASSSPGVTPPCETVPS